jgi:hypothetical protein
VCVGPQGGVYVPPPPIYAPTAASAYYTTAIPAKPTSNGTIADCGNYYDVASGDDCGTISLQAKISFPDLRSFNTQLNAQCTNLWLGYSYCVARVSPAPKSTASAVLTISRRLVQAPASEIAARRLDVVARRVLFVIERIAIADHAQVRRPA